jgi:transposase
LAIYPSLSTPIDSAEEAKIYQNRMEKNYKECQEEKATIVFADEAGFQMAPNIKSTWSPCGKTPILRQVTRSYRKVSAMGAIAVTPGGRRRRVFFRLLENQNFKSETCIAFLEQLKQNIAGKICLVWDRLQAHKSKKMIRYLEDQPRIDVKYFPVYAPELNPVEYMRGYLKGNLMCNRPIYGMQDLLDTTKAKMCATRSRKDLTKSFVDHSSLSYVWRT